ncbi:unnamed protein product [Pieris macdunnoughi]|uniref:Uncharacterized protein n=1 Tax=Pieris macdunnoughi TaxID=345717 RepID=A0A821MLI4_9NEOP|nr:unnamed protein product [Pieris macdunnoughi]
MSKLILLCALFLLVATLVDANGNLVLGSPYGANLIYQRTHKKWAIPLVKRDEVVEVHAPGGELIRGVVVQDYYGTGECHPVGGGIGQRSISLKLKSPRSKGYKFMVDVYAA